MSWKGWFWKCQFTVPSGGLCPCFCLSVAKSCLTLCNPMDSSTPGFPFLYYLPEFAQMHVHWVSDAIQSSSSVVPLSSCPQSFPASGSFSMTRLFKSGGQGIEASTSAAVLPMNILSWFPLGLTGLIYLLSQGFSRVFSSTTIWKHQFFRAQPSFWSNFHICTWLLKKKKKKNYSFN